MPERRERKGMHRSRDLDRTKKRRMVWIAMLFHFLPLVLSGCWDSVDLERRAAILAMAIDEVPLEEMKEEERVSFIEPKEIPTMKKRLMKVTVQIAIPGRIPLGPGGGEGSIGGGGKKTVWVLRVIAHSLVDAMNSLQQQLSQEIFLGYLRVIIISEEFARKGVEDIRDYIKRTPLIRRNAWLIISKGEASPILEAEPALERVPAIYILSTLDRAITIGKLPPIYSGIFFSTVESKGKEGVLPYVELKKEKGNISLEGLAIFRKEKMVGKTLPLEIGLFMEVEGINPAGYDMLVPIGQNKIVALKATYRVSKIEVKEEGGEVKAMVKIYVETDFSGKQDPSIIIDNPSALEKIVREGERVLKKGHLKLLQKTKRLRSDIYGIGEHVRAKLPDYWRKNIKTKERWEKIYAKMPIRISVHAAIRKTGMQAR